MRQDLLYFDWWWLVCVCDFNNVKFMVVDGREEAGIDRVCDAE